MKPNRAGLCLVSGIAVVFAGCVALPLPPEAAQLDVVASSSRTLHVYPPKLVQGRDGLIVRGYGYRTPGLQLPPGSHVDIIVQDRTGKVLKQYAASYWVPQTRPRTVPEQGKFSIHIGSVPPGAARLEVRAHEGKHVTS